MADYVQHLSEPSFDCPADADAAGYTAPGWYFWDETQANCYGPYATEQEARERLKAYAEQL